MLANQCDAPQRPASRSCARAHHLTIALIDSELIFSANSQQNSIFSRLMTTQDNDDLRIDLSLNPAGLRLLLEAVSYRLERWPGGEPEEQKDLQNMQTLLQAAILEANFGFTGER